MIKSIAVLMTTMTLFGLLQRPAGAHCQIPCGIYDDTIRFALMLEDVTTIEKSMAQIVALNSAETTDVNQLVRWVENKEQHAAKLAETVTGYFMTQRVKPVVAGDEVAQTTYTKQITLLHKMLILSMKVKQTTDAAHCAELRTLIEAFRTSYLAAQDSHTYPGVPTPEVPASPVAK